MQPQSCALCLNDMRVEGENYKLSTPRPALPIKYLTVQRGKIYIYMYVPSIHHISDGKQSSMYILINIYCVYSTEYLLSRGQLKDTFSFQGLKWIKHILIFSLLNLLGPVFKLIIQNKQTININIISNRGLFS